MSHKRTFSVDRSSVDAESGTFEAVLFTEGEASDGHIISIEGLRMPDEMPFFVNHVADPVSQLGVLTPGERTEVGGVPAVTVRGVIDTGGVGSLADVRRDVLRRMAAGQLSRFSGRWDAEDSDVTRRSNLPEDHPHYVDPKTASYPKSGGMFFAKSVAQEGSLVGLGADPLATMRWWEADDVPDAARSVYTALCGEDRKRSILETFNQTPIENLEPIEYGDGQLFYVPPTVAAELAEARATEPEPAHEEPVETPVEEESAIEPTLYESRAVTTMSDRHEALESALSGLTHSIQQAGADLERDVRALLKRRTGRS